MIQCPVCSHQNDDFALKCASCSSFIQDRIPNLDFFATLSLLIERPKEAFKKIILAEHKNYVLLLALFFGISAAFALFWAAKFGNEFENILPLIIGAFSAGIVLAIPFFLILAVLIFGTFKIFGGKGNFINTYAVVGWSLFPLALSVFFILPIELATVGLYFFSSNPSGYDYKPEVYSVLIGLDTLCIVWALLLLGLGLSIAQRRSFLLSLILSSAVVAIVYWGIFYGFHVIYY